MTAPTQGRIVQLLRKIERLLTETGADRSARRNEEAREAPAARRQAPAANPIGGRVQYVPVAGHSRARQALTARAAEVLTFLDKAHDATSEALCKGLGVNRNVIAGAMHELRQAHLVHSEPFVERRGRHGAVPVASAAEYHRRPRKAQGRTAKGKKSTKR